MPVVRLRLHFYTGFFSFCKTLRQVSQSTVEYQQMPTEDFLFIAVELLIAQHLFSPRSGFLSLVLRD